MTEFSHLVKDTGFLTEQGEELVKVFRSEMQHIFSHMDTQNRVLVMGSILKKLVGEEMNTCQLALK